MLFRSTSTDFAKMIDRVAQVADAGSMPRHGAEQTAQLPPRCAGINAFGTQDMRRLTNPAKDHLQRRPKISRRSQAGIN